MALKPKNPAEAASNLPPYNERYEEFIHKRHPEVEARLNTFIENSPNAMAYYEYMAQRHPARAARALMLNKMREHEQEMRVVERESPLAQDWLAQQKPTLKEWISQKLKDVNPFYRPKVEHDLIKKMKSKIDFSPRTSLSQGQSI